MTELIHLFLQTLAAAAGTVSFSVLFGVPVTYYRHCALIGGAGWFLYLLIVPASTAAVATFAATVLVILMSRWFAVRKQCPVTIFLISGIIPLVPGAGIYWASFYAVTGNMYKAFHTGLAALKVAIAIVLGIVFVFELPQKLFTIGTRKKL